MGGAYNVKNMNSVLVIPLDALLEHVNFHSI